MGKIPQGSRAELLTALGQIPRETVVGSAKSYTVLFISGMLGLGLGLGLDTKALALPISRPRPGSHSITMCLLDCH